MKEGLKNPLTLGIHYEKVQVSLKEWIDRTYAQPVLNIRPTLTNFPQPLSPPLCVLAGEFGILSKAPRFVGRSKSSRKLILCGQAPESTHVDMVPGTREGYEDAIGFNTPVARKITSPSQGFPFP